MVGQGLRQLQEALNHKADAVQHEFIDASAQLQRLSRKVTEAQDADERAALAAEQVAVHEKQAALADEINLWRDRAREVLRQRGDEMLRLYLRDLLTTGEELVQPAVEYALYLLDAPEEELERLAQSQTRSKPTTPAGRLLERAHTDFDLRGKDPALRQKAAAEFANRTGMAQNDEALAELEAGLEDKDPLVSEVATLTLVQMHRFRAMRLADLDSGHASVERLAQLKHPAAIPVLIEIAATPRTGYAEGPGGMSNATNGRSREAALQRLIEWHTAEAQSAVRARQYDRDTHMVELATRALEQYPGQWK